MPLSHLVSSRVPDDVFNIIVSFSGKQSLVALCLACKRTLAMARPHLYRNVHLKSTWSSSIPKGSLTDTFTLLKRDRDIARRVVNLSLSATSLSCGEDKLNGPPSVLVDADAFRNLSELRSLQIWGNIFQAAQEDIHLQVLEALQGIGIQKLTVKYDFSEGLGVSNLILPDLQSLEWATNNDSMGKWIRLAPRF